MFPVEDKYAGRSRGVVLDNVDPLKRGRIRVNHPLLGETVWINYLQIPNFFDPPEIGDIVYVECDCGSENHPIAWGNILKGQDGNTNLHAAFKRSKPTNRGFYSPDGHLIEIDDGVGPTKTGRGIRFTASNGTLIHIDAESDAIILEAVFGDRVELSAANGLQVTTPAAGGTHLSMKGGKVELGSAQATLTLDTLGDMKLEGPTGNAAITKEGDISITGPVGSATIGKDGAIEIKNAIGSLVITPTGQIELKGIGTGVMELLVDAFTALSTQTAPGFGAPTSTVAKFAELLAKATAAKA